MPGDWGGATSDSVVQSTLGGCPVLTGPFPRVSPWGVEHRAPAKQLDSQHFAYIAYIRTDFNSWVSMMLGSFSRARHKQFSEGGPPGDV